jgi:hypothetical protein
VGPELSPTTAAGAFSLGSDTSACIIQAIQISTNRYRIEEEGGGRARAHLSALSRRRGGPRGGRRALPPGAPVLPYSVASIAAPGRRGRAALATRHRHGGRAVTLSGKGMEVEAEADVDLFFSSSFFPKENGGVRRGGARRGRRFYWACGWSHRPIRGLISTSDERV